MRMSHVTHVNESCHKYEWVMSRIRWDSWWELPVDCCLRHLRPIYTPKRATWMQKRPLDSKKPNTQRICTHKKDLCTHRRTLHTPDMYTQDWHISICIYIYICMYVYIQIYIYIYIHIYMYTQDWPINIYIYIYICIHIYIQIYIYIFRYIYM